MILRLKSKISLLHSKSLSNNRIAKSLGIHSSSVTYWLRKMNKRRGYILGNVVFCSYRINTAKSDFSLKEIKKWMPEWYERINVLQCNAGDY